VAQLLTERGSSTSPAGVITVADLLSRYAPDPVADVEPATTPVTVDSLLRREGHEPHTAARPVDARAARQPATRPTGDADHAHAGDDAGEATAVPAARRGPALRRGAIAAGILLAAGSVFGATAVVSTSSSPAGEVPPPAGGYPGQGLLDPQQQAPSGAIPTVVDNTAQSDPLDPGTGAPTAWMPTAFPEGDGGGSDDAPARPGGSAVPPAGSPQTPQGTPAPSATADPDDGDRDGLDQDGSAPDRPDRGGGNGDQGAPAGPDRQDGSGGGLVGGAVEDLGDALPDPLGDPVSSLGRTVSALL
jgi:hypothetical protein